MKRYFNTLLLIACLTLTSCLQITEELFLESDGSGRYISRIDAGKMMEMMEMVKNFLPDSLRNSPELSGSGLNDSIFSSWPELDKIPGITGIHRTKEPGNVNIISFEFKNLEALNKALYAKQVANPKEPRPDSLTVFTLQKGRLIWNNPLPDAMGDISAAMPADQGMSPDMLKNMAGDMTYTTILHLPGKVTDHTNRIAKIGEDGRTITMVTDLFDRESLRSRHNDIKFK
jgi:hypothetical protein